jgi:predicted  nucleic acid-binding Zn-ribbon protein
MDAAPTDIEARLAQAINAWTQEWTAWQDQTAGRLAQARDRLEQLRQTVPDTPTQLHSTPGQVDQYLAALEERDAQLALFQSNLDDCNVRLEELQAAVSEAEMQRAAVQDALRERDSHIVLLSAGLADRTERINVLEHELATLHAREVTLKSRLEASTLSEDAQAEAEYREQAYAEALARAAALDADLRDEREQAALLESELVGLRGRLTAAQEEIQRLQTQLADRPAEQSRDSTIETIAAFDPRGHKKRIGEILVESGLLNARQLDEVLREQARDPRRRLGALVVERGYTSEHVVARILAAQLRLPFSDLRDEDIDPAAPALLGAHLARLHHCVPMRREDDRLILAMVNPLDLIAIEDVELTTGCRVDPVVATPAAIDFIISRYGAAT